MDYLDFCFNQMPVLSLLLLLNLLPDDDLQKFLDNDNFREGVKDDGEKKYLFNELEKQKSKLIIDVNETQPLKDEKGNFLSPIQIMNLIEGTKIRIEKIRIMINNEISIAHNSNANKTITYVVARGIWLDKNGKKYKKFSKNIGTKDVVYGKNGKILDSYLKEAEKEIGKMMWLTYKQEYPI